MHTPQTRSTRETFCTSGPLFRRATTCLGSFMMGTKTVRNPGRLRAPREPTAGSPRGGYGAFGGALPNRCAFWPLPGPPFACRFALPPTPRHARPLSVGSPPRPTVRHRVRFTHVQYGRSSIVPTGTSPVLACRRPVVGRMDEYLYFLIKDRRQFRCR